eukprot:516760_1
MGISDSEPESEPEPDTKEPEPEPEEKNELFEKVVVRKEIRDLGPDERNRFFGAVETMMKNKKDGDGNDIPGSSDYFRIAGFHGEPAGKEFKHLGEHIDDFCHHHKESFPGWHRIYLWEFEQYLQKADKENGFNKDGNDPIALPFWDWMRVDEKKEDKKDKLAEDILQWDKDPAKSGWPKNFWPVKFWDTYNAKRKANPYKKEYSEKAKKAYEEKCIRGDIMQGTNADQLADKTRGSNLDLNNVTMSQRVIQSFLYIKHYDFASTLSGDFTYSLEGIHNKVHVDINGYMLEADIAAFDIAFWLHHNNIDRIYEK